MKRVELTDIKTIKFQNEHRWTANAKIPGYPRGRTMAIFNIDGELLAIPSMCPHEGANFIDALLIDNEIIECPAHQNRYNLFADLKSYQVIIENEKMFLSMDEEIDNETEVKEQNQPVTFADNSSNNENNINEDQTIISDYKKKIRALTIELAELKTVKAAQEIQVVEDYQQIDRMLVELEGQKKQLKEQNEIVAKSNEFVKRIMDTMEESLIVVGTDYKINQVNKKLLILLGYDSESVIGKNPDIFFDSSDLEKFKKKYIPESQEVKSIITFIISNNAQLDLIANLRSKTGESIVHLIRGSLLFNTQGKKDGLVLVCTNIIELQRMQNELMVTLEKVNERTEELNRTLETVNELKVQQDGDYFLTHLLLAPLNSKSIKSENFKFDFLIRQKKNFEFREKEYEIGGDLCSAHTILLRGKKYHAFINGDAMGKSIQGAGGALVLGSVFLSIIERTRLSTSMRYYYPEKWLKESFVEIHRVFATFNCSMLVSLVIGMLDDETGFMYYINAEHPFIVLYRDGTAKFIESEIQFRKAGTPDLNNKMSIHTFQLKIGDSIIIGSDGRDDVLVYSKEQNKYKMNYDENLFLHRVNTGKSTLEKIYELICESGQLVDDFSLLKIEYLKNEKSHNKKMNIEVKKQIKRNNIKEEISEVESRIKNGNSDPLLLKYLCLLYAKDKDFVNAGLWGETYSEIMPLDTEQIYLVSIYFKKANELYPALEIGRRVVLREPDNVKFLINICDIYISLKNMNKAHTTLQRIRDIDSYNPKIKILEDAIKLR